MVGAAYAAVPIYKAFCQATGYGGEVRRAKAAPGRVLSRTLLIRFDTNVRDLPWTFQAVQPSQTVKIGDTSLAFFRVTNNSDKPLSGRALYNVTPDTAGAYFSKLECFCFKTQTLQPHQTVDFPVVYFVDPRFVSDINTKGEQEVTLSYTYFPAVEAPASGQGADVARPKASQGLGGPGRTRL